MKLLDTLAEVALLVMLIGVLVGAPAPAPVFDAMAWGGLITYLALEVRRMPFKGRAFLTLCVVLAATAEFLVPDPTATFATALTRAAFVGTLYAALGFLRDAAETSPAVRACGRFLAAQPPGKRYLALNAGGHVFGLILNFGVIPLLGAMVVASIGGDDSWRGKLRLRRMMTAINRGFGTILTWSPMTVSVAVVLSSLHGTTWAEMASYGLVSALAFTLLGWGLDRRLRPPQAPREWPKPPGSWRLALPIVGLVLLVFAVGGAWTLATDIQLVLGIMTATPVIGALWLYLQLRDQSEEPAALALAKRLRRHLSRFFPSYRMEIALLSSAAFVGSLVAALLPPEVVKSALDAVPLPPWALVAALAWVIVALGQLGANPVLSVTILTGALPPPEVLGVPGAAVAVALCGAWSLTAATSPFSAATMVTGQMGGTTAAVVGRRWNGWYAFLGLIVLTGWTGVVALVAR